MPSTRSSGLRRSRLTDSESHDGLKRPLSLTEFTKASHKRLLLKRNSESEQQDDAAIIAAAATETTNIHDAESKRDDNISMDQCISLLGPHLTVFRDTCDAAAKLRSKSKETNIENAPENEDEVPSQLLRLARFFAWRWLPIKKALLRPPPIYLKNSSQDQQEVEFSLTYRLRLAKACWKKGLLAAAEYESLCASFDRIQGNECDGSKDGYECNQGDNLMERVRFALMRLPTEVVTSDRAVLAWRHVNEVLLEVFKTTDGSNDDHSERIDQVADWALTSWTAIVVSQGMNASSTLPPNNNNSNSALTAVESQFANLLSNLDASSESVLLAQAVAARIDELLTPDSLKSLNSIHIFSLGRLFARFHSPETAEQHIARSINQCTSLGGMICMEELSRLIAIYVCSIRAINDLNGNKNAAEAIAGLKKRLLAKMDTAARLYNGDSNKVHSKNTHQQTDSLRRQSFLHLVLNAAAHIIRVSK